MGVIAGAAVRAFLKRPRSDYRPWKKLGPDGLAKQAAKLPSMPPDWRKLRLHQKVCVLIGAHERRFGFFLDTGMGKSLLTIVLKRYWRKLAGLERSAAWLILVPNKGNKAGWADEVALHAPHLNILRLSGSSERKWEDLEEYGAESDFIVETYGGFMQMMSERIEDKRKSAKKINRERAASAKKKGTKARVKERLAWSAAKLDQFAKHVDGIVMDESIKIMNKSALPHRICAQVIKRLGKDGFVYELNGTPFGRDPEAIHGQVYLLDDGYSLGDTLGLYRAAFFKEVKGRMGFPEYKFDKSKQKTLHDFLADKTIAYEADEGDLPAVVPIIKTIYLPADAEAYAADAKRKIIAAKGSYTESKNAFMRMRQISSGWLGYKDDETGERASVNFKPNVKLEFLLDYVDTINPKYQYIIFHEFNYSGALICAGLKEMGIPHAWVYGKTKNPEEEVERFRKMGPEKCPALVLSNSAGSYGLNLQMAKYGIYFEAPVSPIIRYQTRKRFERQYSPHRSVFRVDLVVANTYDAGILEAHAAGKDLFDGIIRGQYRQRQSGLLEPAGAV